MTVFTNLLDPQRLGNAQFAATNDANRFTQFNSVSAYGPSFSQQGPFSHDRASPIVPTPAAPPSYPHAHQQFLPRSASEAAMENNSNKYRQLPCRTFISVGTCPYRERCVYLHDPRCICREAKTKTRRKNKEDTVLDSLFWPIMPYTQVAAKLDSNRQPHVIQQYVVPAPQTEQYRNHDEAVYSMWMHFVDFCAACSESTQVLDADDSPCYMAPDMPMNMYTNKKRLPTFRALSSGRPVVEEMQPAQAQKVFNSPSGVHQLHEEQHRLTRTGSFDSFDSSITMSDMSSNRSSFQEEDVSALWMGRHSIVGDGHILQKNIPPAALRYSPDNSASIWTSISAEQQRGMQPTEASKFIPLAF